MKKPLFTGSGVAIVTPFTKETVDLPTLGKLLDFQMKNGTDATTFSIPCCSPSALIIITL